jgi:epoxyqueuosine reductase QueG
MRLEVIEQAMATFLLESPLNTVEELGKMKIYNAPLVGVASIEDPLFARLKGPNVVGPLHLSPSEWMMDGKAVVSYFLPFTDTVRKANQLVSLPATEWLYARIEGEMFNNALRSFLVDFFIKAGYQAISPVLDSRFAIINRKSNWSERHVAYIAGLGTFSLNCSLITKCGSAGRIGSIITNADLEPTERYYKTIDENCIKCGICIRRCPPGAIHVNGKEHTLCSDYLDQILERFRPRYGCGKCQTAVPCEDRIPKKSE